ncbi:MAG: EVE domain-containing protein [Spirochaetia bacterium]|nr:EVE domain-containing protein [Spirochaetia bacterium]
MNYWLVKSEPDEYPWSQLLKEKKGDWTGIRNFQAMQNLRTMKKGDLAFFYHTGKEKAIVGLAKVEKEFYKDPTATEGPWVSVLLSPVKAVNKPVTLAEVKADKDLQTTLLAGAPRLSVQTLSEEHFNKILKMSGTKL